MVTDFNKYITEEKEQKNIHLEHLEDLVLNKGVHGVYESVEFLTALINMLSGHSKVGVNITTKWDGAPAVVIGINPENKRFFVGTKSVFSKTPKINYTEQDIDTNHESPELREKLKVCLHYLPKLGIKTILQGDILFTHNDVQSKEIDGGKYITFTPNTITYAIPNDTTLSERIQKAKLGIVFHTEYSGESLSSLKTSFHVDLGYLHHTKDVWFRDASFIDQSGTSSFTNEETKLALGMIGEINKLFMSLNHKVLQQISINTIYKDLIKMYNNSVIRSGDTKNTIVHTNEMIRWIDDRLSTNIREAKKPETQRKRTLEKTNILGFFHLHNQDIKTIFDLQNAIVSAKLFILHKLSLAESTKSFIQTETGYRVTRPEGFVAVDRLGNAIKLVDRLEFSKHNFNASRNWKQ